MAVINSATLSLKKSCKLAASKKTKKKTKDAVLL